MAKLIFENLTLETAKELAHWYEGAGEQDAYDWMHMRGHSVCVMTDVARKGGFMEVKDGNVHVYLK